MRNRKNSTFLNQNSKAKLKKSLQELKDAVLSSQLDDKKKAKLIEKLEEVEKELDRKRLDIAKATMVFLEIIAIPGGVWTSGQAVKAICDYSFQVIADSKADNDSLSLPDNTQSILLIEDKSDTHI